MERSARFVAEAQVPGQLEHPNIVPVHGQNVDTAEVRPDDAIAVSALPKATDTLEPLRGQPIGAISLIGIAVKSLEPLRGMALTF